MEKALQPMGIPGPPALYLGRDEMKNLLNSTFSYFLLSFLLLGLTSRADATEIRISPHTVKSGEIIDIPLIVDEVDNLAGLKLVLAYDPELLVFKKGAKSKETDSLMHIVNDKKPGSLIIVMAGAKGIQGKNFPVFTVTFEAKKGLKENRTTTISITEVQLMSDQLKEIKCPVAANTVTIYSVTKKLPQPPY